MSPFLVARKGRASPPVLNLALRASAHPSDEGCGGGDWIPKAAAGDHHEQAAHCFFLETTSEGPAVCSVPQGGGLAIPLRRVASTQANTRVSFATPKGRSRGLQHQGHTSGWSPETLRCRRPPWGVGDLLREAKVRVSSERAEEPPWVGGRPPGETTATQQKVFRGGSEGSQNRLQVMFFSMNSIN